MRWTEEQSAPKLSLEGSTVYQFAVLNAEEGESAKGNQYIKLSLRLRRKGETTEVSDWITPAYFSKLKAFAEQTNLLDCLQRMELSANDCIGRAGYLITTDEPDDKGYFGIADYISAPEGAPPIDNPAPAKPSAPAVDDTPF